MYNEHPTEVRNASNSLVANTIGTFANDIKKGIVNLLHVYQLYEEMHRVSK